MTVDADKLLKMADQIIANMSYTDDKAVVAAQVADHLNRFWDPRMRIALREHAAQHGDELQALLLDVVSRLN
jgi:formate dehydrogenase subunit delta